jgi:hypothetical protein
VNTIIIIIIIIIIICGLREGKNFLDQLNNYKLSRKHLYCAVSYIELLQSLYL